MRLIVSSFFFHTHKDEYYRKSELSLLVQQLMYSQAAVKLDKNYYSVSAEI